MGKLPKSFYQQPAVVLAKSLLGKYLVSSSPKGRISGKIVEVEAYPAFTDRVSHGNRRTRRTEVMYKEGGYAYVYVVYGIHHQFAVVVNKRDVPEVVFIRAVVPAEGIEIMKGNFGRPVKEDRELTKSPGNLCKSFGIDMNLYGVDLTGDTVYIEDRGFIIKPEQIMSDRRVGISKSLEGHEKKLRFFIKS